MNPYESKFGYSRAVRKGPFVFVSGTTAVDTLTLPTTLSAGASTNTEASVQVLHPESAYQQALHIFSEIVSAVEKLQGTRADVVRLRMYVSRHQDGDEVGKAMKEVFGSVRPAATMLFGVEFVHPDMRVEIEADAVVA